MKNNFHKIYFYLLTLVYLATIYATPISASQLKDIGIDVTSNFANRFIKIKSVESNSFIVISDNLAKTSENSNFDVFLTIPTADGWIGFQHQATRKFLGTKDNEYLGISDNLLSWECYKIYQYNGFYFLLSQKNNCFVQLSKSETNQPLKACRPASTTLNNATWERFELQDFLLPIKNYQQEWIGRYKNKHFQPLEWGKYAKFASVSCGVAATATALSRWDNITPEMIATLNAKYPGNDGSAMQCWNDLPYLHFRPNLDEALNNYLTNPTFYSPPIIYLDSPHFVVVVGSDKDYYHIYNPGFPNIDYISRTTRYTQVDQFKREATTQLPKLTISNQSNITIPNSLSQKVDNFIVDAVGKSFNPDGAFGLTPVDVIDVYAEELFGNWKQSIGYANSRDIYSKSNSNNFIKIAQDINDPNLIPNRGDIICFSPFSKYAYGLVGVVVSSSTKDVTLITQTDNTPAKLITLPWSDMYLQCQGWLRPK